MVTSDSLLFGIADDLTKWSLETELSGKGAVIVSTEINSNTAAGVSTHTHYFLHTHT